MQATPRIGPTHPHHTPPIRPRAPPRSVLRCRRQPPIAALSVRVISGCLLFSRANTNTACRGRRVASQALHCFFAEYFLPFEMSCLGAQGADGWVASLGAGRRRRRLRRRMVDHAGAGTAGRGSPLIRGLCCRGYLCHSVKTFLFCGSCDRRGRLASTGFARRRGCCHLICPT